MNRNIDDSLESCSVYETPYKCKEFQFVNRQANDVWRDTWPPSATNNHKSLMAKHSESDNKQPSSAVLINKHVTHIGFIVQRFLPSQCLSFLINTFCREGRWSSFKFQILLYKIFLLCFNFFWCNILNLVDLKWCWRSARSSVESV